MRPRRPGSSCRCPGLTETDLGLAAGLQLAAAFDINPLQLNGPQYIETDFLRERVWRGGGRVALPTGPGLGVEVDEDYVRRHAIEVDRRERVQRHGVTQLTATAACLGRCAGSSATRRSRSSPR